MFLEHFNSTIPASTATGTRYHLTENSKNEKTMIPTSTTSADTCWHKCGQFDNCYGKNGNPLGLPLHWKKINAGERGYDLETFCDKIAALPEGQVWRHNQAGDLPGTDGKIDARALRKIVKANRGKRGFTYTHKPTSSAANRKAIKHANDNGFTINLSADNLEMADKLAGLQIGPVVTVLPSTQTINTKTPEGRTVVICPADHVTKRDRGVNCGTCRLCAWAGREVIIGFPAHGSKRSAIDKSFVALSAITEAK